MFATSPFRPRARSPTRPRFCRQRIGSGDIELLHELAQNRHYSEQQCFSFGYTLFRRGSFGNQRIQTRRTLHRRSSCIIEIAGSLLGGTFATTFGSVEQNRQTRSVELIEGFTKVRLLGGANFDQQVSGPGEELEFELIHFEFLMVELDDGGHDGAI